jgi:hypothetical protein
MKRPGWVTTVGVIGIIIGCLGIVGAGQSIMMPKILDTQKAFWTEMKASMTQYDITEPEQMPSPEVMQMMESMWDIPGWFDAFCLIAGVAAPVVCILYVFACIRLLQISPTAIRLFYTAAGIAMVFSVLKIVFVLAALSFMGMSMIVGSLLCIVINVILLIVVATKDKTAFALQAE